MSTDKVIGTKSKMEDLERDAIQKHEFTKFQTKNTVFLSSSSSFLFFIIFNLTFINLHQTQKT
ncbi:transmembrane protein, putative [Medicago truncatula]|uniref:Transmembrane protein, putative n=1 Tax=Medicago truncatula TaxID=3880 RepID=G7IKJ4_MEDTR|nr:transmembrane protein, putative [Medicago truncatula]